MWVLSRHQNCTFGKNDDEPVDLMLYFVQARNASDVTPDAVHTVKQDAAHEPECSHVC